jgi:hypothetical protein
MEPHYHLELSSYNLDWYKALTSATMGLKDIEEQITKEIARLNNIKPIHFKNPEKLNGKYESRGDSLEVMFIGRELSIAEDNWTWLVKELKYSNREHTLSILKYPKLDGYATMIKNAYGQKETKEIRRENLDSIEWMRNELVSLTNLPF